MPPAITPAEAKGFGLCMLNAVMNGRGDELIDLATSNLLALSEHIMDMTAVLLSRIQFACTVSFHIIFPAFTIGLAAWLAVLEAMSMATDRPVYRRLSEFWLQHICGRLRAWRGVGHCDGVPVRHQLERVVAANRRHPGAVAGLRELHRLRPGGKLLRRADVRARSRAALVLSVRGLMVAGGTTLSSFWIMVNNSWMQVPGRLRDHAGRGLSADRLVGDHLQPGRLGALPAHAARGLRDLAPSASRPPARGTCCVTSSRPRRAP